MKIYNIYEKLEFLEEVCKLTTKEWSSYSDEFEFKEKVNKKIRKVLDNQYNKYYAKLILIDDNKLVGFISIFESDGVKDCDFSPWYATMYVKKEYRGCGYSKILDNAIKVEAKKRGFKRLYLKTSLVNYYEKMNFKYLKDVDDEKLYYIDL